MSGFACTGSSLKPFESVSDYEMESTFAFDQFMHIEKFIHVDVEQDIGCPPNGHKPCPFVALP